MLQPKQTKYRKQQKGRNRGLAGVGNRVSFGEYGLRATTRGRILYEMEGVSAEIAGEAFRLAGAKLPVGTALASRTLL